MTQPYLINDIKVGNTASVEIEFIPEEGETAAVKAIELTLMDSERVVHDCLWEKLEDNRFRGWYEIPVTGPAGVWVYRWDTLIGPEAAGELKFNVVGSSFYSSSGDTTLINHGTLIGLGDDDHPQYLLKSRHSMINAEDFGAVGNGTTDDTAALQAWATYITTNRKTGYLPSGNYKITAPIDFPSAYGWNIEGESMATTIITQYTDNTPCFRIGADDPVSQIIHSHTIRGIGFTANTLQASSATSSIGIYWASMVFYCHYENLSFAKLGWGMKSATSPIFAPWGCRFDALEFGNLAIGCINTYVSGGGTPNNTFGRMTIQCGNAIGPMFYLQGYNFHIQVLEFLSANNQQLLLLSSAGAVQIEALKIELATYTANYQIFAFEGEAQIQIGSIHVGGTFADFNPASGTVYLVACGAGGLGVDGFSCRIGTLNLYATSMSGGGAAAISGGPLAAGSSGGFEIDHIKLHNGWVLSSIGSSGTADNVRVSSWQNNRLASNIGDANYTVTLGDPNIVPFNTTFTAARTLTLPAKNSNNNFNGLAYTFIFDGSINGANTAIIKEGANTLRTQTVDKIALTYTWRRAGGVGAWVLTSYQTLP